MNRVIILSLITLFSLCVSAKNEPRNIALEHHGGNHIENYEPADKPEAYYDVDNQEIILVADGFVSSYDVNIISLSTMSLTLHSTANGYGDTIDVSSLPDDDYKIVISTPYNNVYVGFFTNY